MRSVLDSNVSRAISGIGFEYLVDLRVKYSRCWVALSLLDFCYSISVINTVFGPQFLDGPAAEIVTRLWALGSK